MVSAVLVGKSGLPGVSAASGLEISLDGRTAYIVGDDSAFLYIAPLSEETAAGAPIDVSALRRLRMTPSAAGGVDEGIAKKVKPDFECLAAIPSMEGGELDDLLAVGSGSKAGTRDLMVLVSGIRAAAAAECEPRVRVLNARSLMDALRGDARITGAAKLNLEAATVVGHTFLGLFQRGNTPGAVNSVALIRLEDVRDYLDALEAAAAAVGASAGAGAEAVPGPEAVRPPAYTVVHLAVPPFAALDGGGKTFGAGVSGASTFTMPYDAAAAVAAGDATGVTRSSELLCEAVVVSASGEGTDNEIDDGDVLGSRVALLPSLLLMHVAGLSARADEAAHMAGTPLPSPPVIDLGALGLGALVQHRAAEGAAAGIPAEDAADCAVEGAAAGGGAPGGGSIVLDKVEGVAVRSAELTEASAEGTQQLVLQALAVTDPDGGESQALEITFTIPLPALTAAVAAQLA